MATGFVLVRTAPAMEHSVNEELKKVKSVEEFYPLFGEYDFIVKLVASDFDQLGQIIIGRIRTIDGVVDTWTLTGVDL